jgi:hypothetical protein
MQIVFNSKHADWFRFLLAKNPQACFPPTDFDTFHTARITYTDGLLIFL